MRRIQWAVASFGLGAGGMALHAGCANDADDCFRNVCDTASSGTPSGSGGATPEACVPSRGHGPLPNDCGVFVSATLGDDRHLGTREQPFQTLRAALAAANAQGKPIYACAEPFDEAVVVSAPMTLFGGLDCANGWTYVGAATKTALTAPTDAVALTVAMDATTVLVEDFALYAPQADVAGRSSIAVLVDGATVEFRRCDLEAGNGADGSPAAPPLAAQEKADSGNPGGNACDAPDVVNGGPPKANPDCMTSVGGTGGIGVSAGDGGNGSKGSPGRAMNGGPGEVAGMSPIQNNVTFMRAPTGVPGGAGGTPGTAGEAADVMLFP